MRHASIYQLPDRILVNPSCLTEAGFLLAAEPYVVFSLEASNEAIGRAVLDALSSSEKVLPTPTDWKAYSAIRHKAAGVKSEITFQLKAKLVSVEASADGISFEPTHNGGTKGDEKGFHGKRELRVRIPSSSEPQEIGSQLLLALRKCTE